MDSAADQQTGGVASDAGLADISDEPLVDILSVDDDDSPIAHTLRRIRAVAESGEDVMSAFGSFVGEL